MKKRKQNMARFLCLLMVCTVLSCMAGCEGKGGSEPAQPALETVTYSNLTDADSRALLSGLLEKSGVAEARIQALLACVDQFNAAVKPAWLTDGFESAAPTETKYDVYDMQDVWTEKYGNFMGYNCRITAYSLLGGFLGVGADQPETQGEELLFVDLDTIARHPEVLFDDSTAGFCALFAWIATFALEGVHMTWDRRALGGVLYLALFCTMLALLLQNVGQKYASPASASILMSTESVFGILFSVLFAGEVVTPRLAVGFALIFAAVLVSEVQLPAKQAAKK